MSWAAHQFEIYAVHAHLPKKMVGKVSFWGIFLGDFTPDFLSKFWVYGITIDGTRYGADVPHQWHRGFPGMGFTHTVFFGCLVALLIWSWRKNRAFTVGYLLGFAAHALTDINDSVGVLLFFPFLFLNFTSETWAYAATVEGGKYLDAAAYYSSLGLAMDLFWLVVVLFSWRVLTREYWRTRVVPPDARVWAWFGRWLPERGLLALYRATFFYGLCRMISWSAWARLFADPDSYADYDVTSRGFPIDLSWTGPYWLDARSLPHTDPWLAYPAALALLALIFAVLIRLWEPMGTREELARAVRRRSRQGGSPGSRDPGGGPGLRGVESEAGPSGS